MAQHRLSSEESSVFEIMKILREDDKASLEDIASLKHMARLIPHADYETRMHFYHLSASIQEGQRSTLLHTSVRTEQQALWIEFSAIEIEPRIDNYAAACEGAAKLISDAWIKYPRPGTEQPGPHNENQKRRLVCNDLFQCAAILVQKMEATARVIQNQRWTYTFTDLLDKFCW